MKVWARERYFIRIKDISKKAIDAIQSKYTFHFFEERACNQCEWVGLRRQQGLLGECEACAAYRGSALLATKVKVGENQYLATPLGDFEGLCKILKKYTAEDIRKVEKHPVIKIKPIKFTGEARGYQEEAVQACIKGEKGVLYAPPRSGKTIMLSKMICDLSVKSLIIASQRDWLMGFYETFVGSDTQKALTDIDKSRIGFCKKLTDFDKYDICLATVQTFHSESGQVLLKKLRDKFTLVGIDEVHTSSANRYIQEISRFNCKYKIGLTGTPDRKDGKYVLTEAVVGPILYEAKVERLRPTIRCVRTHFSDGSKSSVWAYIVRKVESNQARMDLIAEWALKDMAAGHMIIIPFTQVKPILKCIEIINQKAGKTVAYPFYGALKKEVRDDTIQKAREYKIKIIVGNMRLLGTGINIPRCSCIYNSTLSSNIPQSQQRFSRILTPCEGKPAPMIRLFLDDIQVARSCLNNEYWNSIKKFDPIIDDKTEAILTGYLKERDRYNMWNRGGF